jgi:hypothetical protein
MYGVLFGIWIGVGLYRLFEMLEIDAMSAKEGVDTIEEYGVSRSVYTLMSLISAFGWPVIMPYAYWVDRGEEDDG